MIHKAFLLIACITLAGCATYGHRGGSGIGHYGSTAGLYRHAHAPYGGVAYPLPYGRYDIWQRSPFGYGYGYGGGYYRPPPVIVRPVYPGRPGGYRPPPRPDRPGIGRPDRSDRPGIGRPDRPGRPGFGGRAPDHGDANRPGRPGADRRDRRPRDPVRTRPEPRPGGQRPGQTDGRPRQEVQRSPRAAPVLRSPAARAASVPSARGESRTPVTARSVEPM